ncbi:MAG TPA: hypothetical protein VML75_27495 [Kofleriaceae bacterium]|nr:hypothetical protein [Kofleriaceae bacterium]
MRPTNLPTNLVVALALSMMLPGAGCTDADQPVIILQNQVPDDGCIVPVGAGSDFRPRGIIDTQSGAGYLFTPLAQNNAAALDGNPTARLAIIEGAEVALTLQDSAVSVAEGDTNFTKRFSGSIQPNGGLTSFAFTIIDKRVLDAIAGVIETPDQRFEVLAEVRLFGTMGGGDLESIPFTYAVDVCTGCMRVNVGPCADLADDFVPLTGGKCNPLQDVFTQCCTELDESLTCPAAKPSPEGV